MTLSIKKVYGENKDCYWTGLYWSMRQNAVRFEDYDKLPEGLLDSEFNFLTLKHNDSGSGYYAENGTEPMAIIVENKD